MNGAGKSSFVDAMEFALRSGKLSHLTHEYSGKNQEKAIPNTHTPEKEHTEFVIKFTDDSDLTYRISKNGTYRIDGSDTHKIGTWDYRRIVLRQDEVAEFIRSRKGEKYSALLPLLGLQHLEITAQNLRQLSTAIEKQSKLGQKQGALDQTASKRLQVFGSDSDEDIEKKIIALHKIYCPDSESIELPILCQELEVAITQRIVALTSENQRYLTLSTIGNLDFTTNVQRVRELNSKLSASVEPLISEKLTVLKAAEAFSKKLQGNGDIECPACGIEIKAQHFKEHIAAEHARLAEIILIYGDRLKAIGILIDSLKTLIASISKTETRTWRDELKRSALKNHVEWVEQCDSEALRDSLSELNLKAIEKNCLPIIDAAKKASQTAPPDIKDLAKDQNLIEVAKAVLVSIELAAQISRIENLISFVKSLENGVREEIRERSAAIITDISDVIGDMWKSLHPGEPIEDVRLQLPEDDKAIDIALKFHGVDQDSPRLTLSEGYRNSLGLCIFLAMAKRDADMDRPLFLDDVVVSLDRNHRGMIVDLLEKEFASRQVILFTHDRDWFSELRQQLDVNRWSCKTLLPYETPVLGIRWSQNTTTFDDARSHLHPRPDFAGNDARKIMDYELSVAAEKLKLNLPYLRGDKNDKRIWSDFLNRLIADGRKCFQKKDANNNYPIYSEALDLLENARRLLVTWANKSSHSPDVVRPEAAKLIDACEKALETLTCSSTECKKPVWFADAGGSEWVQCRCGDLRWRYGKG